MESRWSEAEAAAFLEEHRERWGEDLALRTHASRLLGADPALVLHGGGNTSVKTTRVDRLGEERAALLVKASGHDLATLPPFGHVALDLTYLARLRQLGALDDEAMFAELETHRLEAAGATPSLEALLHAFLPPKFIDHTHADAILALTNRPEGEAVTRAALGDDVIVVGYVLPGFALAKAAADAFDAHPGAKGMVLMHHGLLTWGETAAASYAATVELVTRAETALLAEETAPIVVSGRTDEATARERYRRLAPVLRGRLAAGTGDADRPWATPILRPLVSAEARALVDAEQGRQIACTAPLTTDHLVRTKPLPLWLDAPRLDDAEAFGAQLAAAVEGYTAEYDAYFERQAERLAPGLERFDSLPRVVLIPGLGAVCAGRNVQQADIVRDITQQTLGAKLRIAASGPYAGLDEAHLFDMEYRAVQHAKLGAAGPPLERTVALVTGAAGAIGSGIVDGLLAAGCHVALSDLPGDALESQLARCREAHSTRVMAAPLDVTDPAAVADGFGAVCETWGGIDLVVPNAGLAHVATLAEMKLEDFRRLTRVNVEGTLHLLAEAARLFARQGTGGDVVLISTKNVFCPGASFGAYSATKAGAHQLARIASLELAPLGVRVNMVAPDAVFSHGARRSGLWAEVGPGRMRARNLDEQGLQEYYRNRNLLKARVTAEHVARAVIYFATRQSPTTGATLPVDGGLPDATPR